MQVESHVDIVKYQFSFFVSRKVGQLLDFGIEGFRQSWFFTVCSILYAIKMYFILDLI